MRGSSSVLVMNYAHTQAMNQPFVTVGATINDGSVGNYANNLNQKYFIRPIVAQKDPDGVKITLSFTRFLTAQGDTVRRAWLNSLTSPPRVSVLPQPSQSQLYSATGFALFLTGSNVSVHGVTYRFALPPSSTISPAGDTLMKGANSTKVSKRVIRDSSRLGICYRVLCRLPIVALEGPLTALLSESQIAEQLTVRCSKWRAGCLTLRRLFYSLS